MSRKCVVWTCFNKRGKLAKEKGISFHRFPRDINVLAHWIRILRLYNYDPEKRVSSICSQHFHPNCFTIGSKKRRTLRAQSLPSLIYFPKSEEDFSKPKENLNMMEASRRSAVFKHHGRKVGRPPKKREELRYEDSDDEGQHVFSPPSSPEDGKLTIDLSPVTKHHTDEDAISFRSNSSMSLVEPRGNPATRFTSTPEVVEIASSPTTLSSLFKSPSEPGSDLEIMQPKSAFQQPQPYNYSISNNQQEFESNDQLIMSNQINNTNNMQMSSNNVQINSNNVQISSNNMQMSSNNVQISSNNMQMSTNNMQMSSNSMQMDSNSMQSFNNAQNSVQSMYSQDNSMTSNLSSNGQNQLQNSSNDDGPQISDVYSIAQQLDNMQQDNTEMSNSFPVTTTEFDAVYLEEILLQAKEMGDTKPINQEIKLEARCPTEMPAQQQQMQQQQQMPQQTAPEMPLFSPPPVPPSKIQFEDFIEEDMNNPDLARNFYLCSQKLVSELNTAKTNLQYENNAIKTKLNNYQLDCNKYRDDMNKLHEGYLGFKSRCTALEHRIYAMQHLSQQLMSQNSQQFTQNNYPAVEQPKKRRYTRNADKIEKPKIVKGTEKVRAQTFNVPPVKLAENMVSTPSNYNNSEVNLSNSMVPNVNYNTSNYRANLPHSSYPRSQSVIPFAQTSQPQQAIPSPILPNQNSPTTPLPSYTDLVAKTGIAGTPNYPNPYNYYPAHYRMPNTYYGQKYPPMYPHIPTPYYPQQYSSEVMVNQNGTATHNFNDVNKEWNQNQNTE